MTLISRLDLFFKRALNAVRIAPRLVWNGLVLLCCDEETFASSPKCMKRLVTTAGPSGGFRLVSKVCRSPFPPSFSWFNVVPIGL